MTTQRFIYPKDDGGIVVWIPAFNNAINDTTGEWLPLTNQFLTIDGAPIPAGFRLVTIEDIAGKVTPAGKPYQIIDVSELPSFINGDRTIREAWEYDDGN